MTIDNSLGTGAYYELDDYAGFMRRLLVMLIDSLALFFAGMAVWFVILAVSWNIDPTYDPTGVFFLIWATMTWVYLVPLKRSRFRTIAYQLLGLKIVSTKGERPSLFSMTFRMLIWIFGPINFLLDIAWLGADTEGQSLRDCYAGTYVVRSTADPIGFAQMHLTRYNGAGMTLAYPRVCRPKDISHDAEQT